MNSNRHSSSKGLNVKPKNLKTSLLTLFKNLQFFKFFIIVALILAMTGAILSLLAPNKLSKLTDEISYGITINSNNLKLITDEVTKDAYNKDLIININEILNIELNEKAIFNIKISSNISSEDLNKFDEVISKIQNDKENTIKYLGELPDSILDIILNESIYKDTLITINDKKIFLNIISKVDIKKMDTSLFKNIPKSIKSVLLNESVIDNIKISSSDKVDFISLMGTMKKDDFNSLYKKLDESPSSIKKLVEPSIKMKKIKNITIGLVILYVCSAIFSFIQGLLMTEVANKFAKKLRSRISVKINKLPLKYFDNNLAGDILSRVTNDVDTIAQSMNQSLATLVSSLTLFIGSIIMMFYTNWIMAITAILASVIGFILMFIILGKSQKYFTARQVELGKLNGHIEEIYSGLNVVKVYNGKKDASKKFDLLNYNVYECNRKSQFLSGLMHPIMGFIGNFGYVAVCIVGAILTSKEIITFGVIVAFMTYVRLFTNPLTQIAQAMTSLQSTAAASERVFEFLDETEMDDEKNITKKLDPSKVVGNIIFDNVKFGYNNDKMIIKGFSAKINKGEKIAIVGPTGAGKTTMVNLLMKFYNINSGDIKIDGISINKLKRENIHSLFTMVLQDTWIFNGTVRENIVYNNKNITDEEIIKVCKEVGVHHFIKTLPNGYDSILSDNDGISGGQKQLLTIARGMLSKAPLLILDEATSNVDTRTEELVSKAMDKLAEGKTSFIIAHRLSTIKNADLILVMKDGNIIEQGNHDELIKQNGFYADLYNSQFQK